MKEEMKMKSLDMVIVVSISGLTGTDESLRLQAWGTVTNLLRPELGKLYRQFNPSNGVWEHKISRPFGVVLGKQEPEVFRQLLVAGEEAQREAVAFHTAGMLRKADLGGAQKMLLCRSNGSVDPPQIHIRANYKGMTVVESIPCGDVLRRWLIS